MCAEEDCLVFRFGAGFSVSRQLVVPMTFVMTFVLNPSIPSRACAMAIFKCLQLPGLSNKTDPTCEYILDCKR